VITLSLLIWIHIKTNSDNRFGWEWVLRVDTLLRYDRSGTFDVTIAQRSPVTEINTQSHNYKV
jgi:hypothetical protein